MSVLTKIANAPLWPRAGLVLLLTVLAHAVILDRVGRGLSGLDAPIVATTTVSARLLPLAPAAPVVAAPAPAVAAAARRSKRASPVSDQASASAPVVAAAVPIEPVVNEQVAIEPEQGAPVQTPAAEVAPGSGAENVVAGPLNAERGIDPIAAADGPEFEAAGPALSAALGGRPGFETALPKSAQYRYRTSNSELSTVTGATTIDWAARDDGSYRVRLATSAVGFTVLELESQGMLRAFGLAPQRYTETRIRRAAVAADFDWDGGRVTFSAKSHERALRDGVQDRLSFQFQLMLLGQVLPQRFRRGAETVMYVAGRDDVSTYRFRSAGRDVTRTGLGELDTVKVERVSASEADARVEVWLAPDLAWLPVRLRFTDRQARVTESVLEQIGDRP